MTDVNPARKLRPSLWSEFSRQQGVAGHGDIGLQGKKEKKTNEVGGVSLIGRFLFNHFVLLQHPGTFLRKEKMRGKEGSRVHQGKKQGYIGGKPVVPSINGRNTTSLVPPFSELNKFLPHACFRSILAFPPFPAGGTFRRRIRYTHGKCPLPPNTTEAPHTPRRTSPCRDLDTVYSEYPLSVPPHTLQSRSEKEGMVETLDETALEGPCHSSRPHLHG